MTQVLHKVTILLHHGELLNEGNALPLSEQGLGFILDIFIIAPLFDGAKEELQLLVELVEGLLCHLEDFLVFFTQVDVVFVDEVSLLE